MNYSTILKPLLSLLCLSIFSTHISAQDWTRIGMHEAYDPGEYGYYETQGEYSGKNCPAYNTFTRMSWNANDEQMYLYESFDERVRFWEFDTEIMMWRCLTDTETLTPHFGTQGVFSAENFPGERNNSAMWVDLDGNLWLYSGARMESFDPFCDLWKYDRQMRMWAWISGSNDGQDGSYETLGIPSATAFPSFRGVPSNGSQAETMVDNNGNLVLFRGAKSNDLWRYNISANEWTWLSGMDPSNINSSGVQEVLDENSNGDPSRVGPRSLHREKGYFWVDSDNNYMLMDGQLTKSIWQFWQFDTKTNFWTNVKRPSNVGDYSLFNEENETIQPKVWDNSNYYRDGNTLLVFGGEASSNSHGTNTMCALNLENLQWTFKAGYTTEGSKPTDENPGFAGNIGQESPSNLPSIRANSLMWKKDNKYFIGFGINNDGFRSKAKYDIWSYDLGNNAFVLEGGRGSLHDNNGYWDGYSYNDDPSILYNIDPDEDFNLATIKDGDNLYSFHTNFGVYKTNLINNQSILIRERLNGNTGTVGIEDSLVFPSYFYIIGQDDGFIYGIDFWKSDLFKFNKATENFIIIQDLDASSFSDFGEYNDTNFPGLKYNFCGWLDDMGNLYIFGGNNGEFPKNELWKFDIVSNQWAVLSGVLPNFSSSDSQGPFALNVNWWIDRDYNLWLYGGFKYQPNRQEYQPETWKFDIETELWELVKLGTGENTQGFYGEQRNFSIFNNPQSRSKYANWVDKFGRFWMLNGDYYNKDEAEPNKQNILDIWMFDPVIEQWTWVDGGMERHEKDDPIFDEFDFVNPMNPNKFTIVDDVLKLNAYATSDENDDVFIHDHLVGTMWKGNIESLRPLYNIFGGLARYDDEMDGCDEEDLLLANLQVIVDEYDEFTFTDSLGRYYMFCNETACNVGRQYEVDYWDISPPDTVLDFGGYGQYVDMDYCFTSKGDVNDLEIHITPLEKSLPGFLTTYKISYRNKGTTTLTGNVMMTQLDSLVFVRSTPDTLEARLDTLLWEFEDLKPFEKREIIVDYKFSSFLDIEDTLTQKVEIFTPEPDETEDDNVFVYSNIIVSSFDPNDKQILQGKLIPATKIGDYVHFMIRFENLGTANARFVVLRDTIDESYFDLSTFQGVDWSHDCSINIRSNNALEVYFDKIDLPFEPEEGNKGYFVFKIKTRGDLNQGDIIRNKASIYFDYNDPIVTNEAFAQFEVTSSTTDIDRTGRIHLMPNPTSNMVYFENPNVEKVDVFNAQGVRVKSFNYPGQSLSLASLPDGTYVLKFKIANSKAIVEKVVLLK